MKRIGTVGLAVVALAIVLVACGGGGGGGGSTAAPASAPTVTVAYQPKQVVLGWNAVSGATYYRVLKNPDSAGFSAVASNVTGTSYADTVSVHLTDWVNLGYRVEACNSGGCTASAGITALSNVNAIGYVKAFNTGAGDIYGHAVALSSDGSTLAVGARYEDSGAAGIDGDINSNSSTDSGAVYVYGKDPATGLWSRQAYVKASNTGAGDYFGDSLSLSSDGNTLAVGAPLESSSATGVNGSQNNNSAAGSGAVYIFTRSSGSWSQQAYIKSSNTGTSDQFGDAVALSGDGNTLAVGAVGESSSETGIGGSGTNNSALQSGAVYVFTRSGTNWSQQAYVKASNTNAYDAFGASVSLSQSGDTLAVGAWSEDSNATGVNGDQSNNAASGSGAVYVFQRASGFWSQQAYLKSSNTGTADAFGTVVSLSGDGNTLAVAAPDEDSSATGIGGNQADDTEANSGAVYVFQRASGSWTQQAYVKASNTQTWDFFGTAVSLSADGSTLAVGAPGEQSSAVGVAGDQTDNSLSSVGAIYVYRRTGSVWQQRSYVKASNAGDGDYFGYYVALSSDGTTLAVGAQSEAGGSIGINGDQTDNSASMSGAVYLY